MGRYEILNEIGRGGMGIVYRARDTRLGKIVALKVLSDATTMTPQQISRFRHEAHAAAILNHPAIVAVYDFDEEQGRPFIIYEYAEGRTLDTLIAGERQPESRVVRIGSQIAGGLAYAHERGILHRDIKPQNIMVLDDGRVKILDFGLAKRTQTGGVAGDQATLTTLSNDTTIGTIVGTVRYMAPEQISGETLDGRTDIFSLGVVLYEMVTRANPFEGQSLISTIGKIMSPESLPFSTPFDSYSPELAEIIRKSVEKRREKRYSSARMLAEDLDRIGTSEIKSQPMSLRRAPEAQTSRVIPRPVARVSLILLQVLYLGLYGVSLYKYDRVLWWLYQRMMDFDVANPLEWARLSASVLLVSACCGIPVRLYLLASVGFDDPLTGVNYAKLFPFLFLLDEIWALTPFLLIGKWTSGITIICVALLVYAPISTRPLMQNAYHTKT